MNSELFNKIKLFVVQQRWEYDFPLERKTTLQKDLSITGDDAVEFIFAFSKQFNVDVSNFMMTEYFDPEGDRILPSIIRFFTGKPNPKRKELTLGDLEKAIIAGKLDENTINYSDIPV